uniref:Acyl-[acyl-carrier-protein] hydrolase n=1 Tax=Kalanchoe fedtschenkoi TaxID=63787 RepID=A0A7N0RFD9_KALFE
MRKMHRIWVIERVHIKIDKYPTWSDVVEKGHPNGQQLPPDRSSLCARAGGHHCCNSAGLRDD